MLFAPRVWTGSEMRTSPGSSVDPGQRRMFPPSFPKWGEPSEERPSINNEITHYLGNSHCEANYLESSNYHELPRRSRNILGSDLLVEEFWGAASRGEGGGLAPCSSARGSPVASDGRPRRVAPAFGRGWEGERSETAIALVFRGGSFYL